MIKCLGFLVLFVFIVGCHSWPGCRWPCKWRNIPWYFGAKGDSLWFVDKNGLGTYNNVSEPAPEFTKSECIERRGSFFVTKEYGVYYCFKAELVSPDVWYVYYSKEVKHYNPQMFCKLCDLNDMEGPLFGGSKGYIYKISSKVIRPKWCTMPAGCPKYSKDHIPCPPYDQPIDDGRACTRPAFGFPGHFQIPGKFGFH